MSEESKQQSQEFLKVHLLLTEAAARLRIGLSLNATPPGDYSLSIVKNIERETANVRRLMQTVYNPLGTSFFNDYPST